VIRFYWAMAENPSSDWNLSHKSAPAGLDAVARDFRVARHSGEMFFTVIFTPRNFVPKGNTNPSGLPDTALPADDR
jgi:hypothetical protein